MGFLAPVFGAIGTFFGSIGIIGKAIIGIGLNLLVGKLTEKKSAKKQPGGVEFEREYGENVSRKVACGLVGIAGHDCYVNTYGSSNKNLDQIYRFADFPCDGLSKIWAGGKLLTLTVTSSDAVKTVYSVTSGDYAGRMSFTFYHGTQTAADAGLVASSNPTGRWTANHIGTGICYLIARLTYDQEKLNQFPDFFFELRGARLYDPRKDSTVGGSGAQRWDNYSTYEFSENPIVQEYNYRRGFSINDDMFCGMGMDAVDLPLDRYFTAMNICDELVSGEPRYRCSIMFDADVEHGDNIESVMVACGGIVIDSVEGSWPLIGTDQPIVETFTDDDLIVGEPVRFQRRRSMADLVNAVSGTYPEPANMWSPAGYDTQTNAAYVALDRRSRDVTLELPTVRSKLQANQLASIYFNENRYEATADIVLRPRFQTVKAGDWVQWNSARYGNRTYMVQARSIKALTSDGPRNVALSLQERDGGIYDGVGVDPPVIPIPNDDPVYLNELQDFSVAPVIGVGADGRTYPAFRVSWSPIEDSTVTGIVIEWWIEAEPGNKFSRQITPDQTLAFIQEGILSLTDYQFRHRLIADRTTNWTAPIDVTSLDGGNGDLEVGLDQLKQDVLDRFHQLQHELDDNRPLLVQLQEAFQLSTTVFEQVRRTLTMQVGSNKASFDEQVKVTADALSAAATQVTTLTATVNSNKATADQQIATVTSAVNAAAAQTTALSASVDDRFAGALVKFAVAANQSGVDARFSVMLRGSINGAFKESGMFLELYTQAGVQKSRFAVLADQFVVTDGSTTALPMVFENGQLKLNAARIGTIRGGAWISDNDKLQINGVLGTIEVFS